MLGKGNLFDLNESNLENINTLLHTLNISSIQNVQGREYFRVAIKSKTFCTRHYKRMQKRDNSTVIFMENAPSYRKHYGIIEKFIVVDNYKLAIITKLKILQNGLPYQDSDITSQAAEVLFQEYLYYEESDCCMIFVHQIFDLCCNLSQSGWNLLTWFSNNIEID